MSKRIRVMYGDSPVEMVPPLLEALDVAARIPSGATVGIKPNLVVSKPSHSGATTDPVIVETVISYLRAHGVQDIVILESAWVGDSTEDAFDVCGYRGLSERHGVPLFDLKADSIVARRSGGVRVSVCRRALDVDFLINIPVLKVHSQTRMTCALKNLKGVIPDDEKQRFHALGLHRPIAALADIVRSHFVLVDGIIGDLSNEVGGNPVAMNRLIAGDDPVLVDAYAAGLLGYTVADIPYIGLAEKLGVGSADVAAADISALNGPSAAPVSTTGVGLSERFADHIEAREACSPCIGGLLHALHRTRWDRWRNGQRISVGQGFKGRTTDIGIGNCTKQAGCYLKGCPPSAADIVAFLERLRS